jgi:hypothetical protein
VAQTIAINNALSSVGAGVKIGGYNYSYDIRNMNGDDRQGGIDTLNVYQSLIGTNGSALLSSQQTYNTKFEWMSVTGTKSTATPIDQANASYLKFSMTGGDNGYWGGYFGPQVRNVSMSLNYVATPVTQHTMGDDGWVNVPLQFGFPFYGKVFTNSFMFDNGVVGLFDPVAGGCNPANGYCGGQQWNSEPFSNNMGNQFSYMIAPLWADLAPNNNTRYLTQGDTTFQKYTWENIGQYYDQSKLQTFDLTIKPSGFIGVNYGQVNLNQTNISVGTIGNPALGEYNQIAYHPAGTTVTGLNNWTLNNTPDGCTSNPLSSPSCPGYTDAMCSTNPLYATTCPGYQQAYFSQQCSANPLYSQACPGYAAAYLIQQCSINPLYSTTCDGYDTAYFNQQCSLDPLYNSRCTGYETAYHDQQCSISPLYATDCTGYAAAYKTQQCSLNALYATDCPGYDQAYLNAQCLIDSLYSTQCEGYKTAYAIKYLVGLESAVTTAVNTSLTNTVETQRNDPANVTGAVDAYATATGTTSATTSTSSATSATTSATSVSPVAVISTVKPTAPAPVTATVAQAEPKKEEAKKEEKKDEGSKSNGGNSNGPSNSDSKPSDGPKTARQELAEKRREAAAKEAVAKGKDLANEMGKAADMESQKAVQNVVIQAMGFTPGFDTYNKAMLPDSRFYAPKIVYGGQVNVDNKNVSRRLMGGSDRVHQDMVDSQYNRGN